DRVDADAEAADVEGEALGEVHQSGVGGASGDVAGGWLAAGVADDVEDGAGAALAHPRQQRAGEPDVAPQLEVVGGAPGLIVDAVDGAAGDGAGIVDKDIDLPQPVHGKAGERLDLIGL